MVFVISISLFEQIVKLYSVTYNCEIRKKKQKKNYNEFIISKELKSF